MNGAHDLGGMHGFSEIDRSQTGNFAQQWEQKVFALTLACGMQGKWNLDQSRFAREQMEPAHYLGSSYYEHWLYGLEVLLQQREIISDAELATGKASKCDQFTPVEANKIRGILASGGPTQMATDTTPAFQIGDTVLIANRHPSGHTRMPRYIRGRSGVIVLYHNAHIFPDVHAASAEKQAAHLYTVRFTGAALWGDRSSEPNTEVCVDVFEPYIERLADAS